MKGEDLLGKGYFDPEGKKQRSEASRTVELKCQKCGHEWKNTEVVRWDGPPWIPPGTI